MSTRRLWVLLPLAVLGCGDPAGPPVLPAGGTVTLGGKPAAGALVVFHPLGGGRANDPKPFATVADDGTFALTTRAAGDGAAAGEYGVTVVWNVAAKAAKLALSAEGVPTTDKLGGRYGDPRNPPLKAAVKPGDPNRFTFELK